jgi:hypothetical protein
MKCKNEVLINNTSSLTWDDSSSNSNCTLLCLFFIDPPVACSLASFAQGQTRATGASNQWPPLQMEKQRGQTRAAAIRSNTRSPSTLTAGGESGSIHFMVIICSFKCLPRCRVAGTYCAPTPSSCHAHAR